MTTNPTSLHAHVVSKTIFLDGAHSDSVSADSGSGVITPENPDIFATHFPGAKVEKHILHGHYVSDELTQEWLGSFISQHLRSAEWSESGFPFMVAAPTGAGKNHFVHHVVRPYAASRGQKVLYLCNRKALALQQMREADRAVNPPVQQAFYPNDAAEYSTGSITLMTYHHYFELLRTNGDGYFSDYSIIVADEAHFFAADALFNPDTSDILDSIPRVFSHAVRIYMTATPEDVLDPIYAVEWRCAPWVHDREKNALRDCLTNELYHVDRLPSLHVFTMPWDFSAYWPYVFSKMDSLLREIKNDSPTKKWVIFVTSKETGKDMHRALRDMGISTAYLDSDSRRGTLEERQLWDWVIERGIGKFRVLITTSVLDNGFGIHDKSVTRIVLFTDDRTTFLQELGRVRLASGQKVRVYFPRMDKTRSLHAQMRQSILDTFALFCGSDAIQEYPPNAEIKPSPNGVLTMKTAPNARQDLGYVSSHTALLADGTVGSKPYINYMARWTAKLLSQRAEDYDRLLDENPKLAPILYKARWLTEDPKALTFENLQYVNIEIPTADRAAAQLTDLYAKYANAFKNGVETKASSCFESFSKEFQALYIQLCPDDRSVNKGKNRKPWKHKAIISHMQTLADLFGKDHPEMLYTLEQGDDGLWRLEKVTISPDS